MLFDYLDEEKLIFYFKNGNQMIKYKSLHSSLLYMVDNNLAEQPFIIRTTDEEFNLKILTKFGDNKFEFKIDNSPILFMYGKKKIFFEDKDGNMKHQIYIYNKEQLFKFQMYLIEKNERKNVDFFDESNNLITDTDSDEFFDLVHHLKINEDSGILKEKQNNDYYKNIFDKYIKNNYSNDEEKLSFNLDKYSDLNKSEFKSK